MSKEQVKGLRCPDGVKLLSGFAHTGIGSFTEDAVHLAPAISQREEGLDDRDVRSARTRDPLFASLGFARGQPREGVWSPQPTFMLKGAQSVVYLLLAIALFSVSLLFGSLGKFGELWKETAGPNSVGDHLARPAAGCSSRW